MADKDDLTDMQHEIIETWAKHPDATVSEISERVSSDLPSYVARIRRKYADLIAHRARDMGKDVSADDIHPETL